MKIKTVKLTDRKVLHSGKDPTNVVQWSETDASNALSEINKIRPYLEQLKKEIYTAINAGYEDVSCFNTIKDITNPCFKNKPSVFFEAAYTIQTFDNNGVSFQNRQQPFIDAGVRLNNYFKGKSRSSIDVDQLFLNDAGQMVGAINSSISQLNRVESFINQKKYSHASASAAVVDGCIEAIIESSKQSSFIELVPNQNAIEKIINSLIEAMQGFISLFKNINKSPCDINKEKCEEMKSRYQP